MNGPETDLTARVLAIAAERPAAHALLADGRRPMTFGSMARRIERMRLWLGDAGVERGDVVIWSTAARPATAAAIAILPVSSTLVPLSATLTPDVATDAMARLGPMAVAIAPGESSPIAVAARALGLAVLEVVDDASGEAGAFDLARPARTLPRGNRLPPAWALVGMTSGTTGRPKLVPHGHRQVMETARVHGGRLALGPDDISGHLSPLHLAGGIRSAYLQGLLNGGATNILPEFDVEAFVSECAGGRVTHVSASFTFFRELLARFDAGSPFDRGRLRFVRVASGRLEAGEMDRLEARLGVPVVTGLASSEAGTTAQQGLPPAPRVRGSVGAPLGCEVRLVDDGGRVVGAGEVGEIQVRGPQVFDGYVDDPELDARTFVEGWFRLGDLARFDARGELHVVGRAKEVINRGGEKISPVEIDDALRAVDGVADAAAFAIAHPRLGEEVVAAVVLRPGADADAERIAGAVRERLGARRAPRRIWFVDSLPRTDAGKLRRAALPAWVGFEEVPAAPFGARAAASAMEAALVPLWASAFGRPGIARDADFRTLGGDDALGARLLDQVHAVFAVRLPVQVLDGEGANVAGMARLIERTRSAATRGDA
ncbi:HIP---CoA ligase [Burkholderiales bacterium]|nr:HIP---CoA ligase [Burkholderiales bacterium]